MVQSHEDALEVLQKELEKHSAAMEGTKDAKLQYPEYAYMANFTRVKPTSLIVHGEPCQWFGHIWNPYPETIPNRESIYCHYEKDPKEGVVGGVAFADGTDSTARKWLVAFDFKNAKVYAEAGHIGPTDWNVVKARLDHPDTTNSSWKKFNGVEIGAFIDPRNNHLGVSFWDYVDEQAP